MTRTAAEIRQEFIEFFRQRGHEFVPSSPVVPHDDPTLLFTNAGMNQFKDVFLATGTRPYRRAANTQKCIRAGGKHNDLDDVGHDTYHHTFFEMLGNWSFGDYFKKEAIGWAWELLTSVWGLDKARLHATYFGGDQQEGLQPDLEAKELWATVTDIDPTHIHAGGKKDNFWEMGETGPCGPCSEIHVDLTPDISGIKLVNAGDPRVIEIWNLVFIQFNRDAAGKLTPLPAKHVDTGMGFERVCALLQGKSGNYDTDIFTPIFQAIRELTRAPPYAGTLPEEPRTSVRAASETSDTPRGLKPAAPQGTSHDHNQLMIDTSYRVIADHVRCLTFALTDGGVPDREGRGYVLRRILRRAACYGRLYLAMERPFLYRLVPIVVQTLDDAFPEIKDRPQEIAEIIREEEELFHQTFDRNIPLFRRAAVRAAVCALPGGSRPIGPLPEPGTVGPRGPVGDEAFREPDVEPDAKQAQEIDRQVFDVDGHYFDYARIDSPSVVRLYRHRPTISGEDAFRLHDTHGFLIDVTQIMAEDKGLRVDFAEYERLMEEARDRARQARLLRGSVPPPTGTLEVRHKPARTEEHHKHVTLELEATCRGHYDPNRFLAQSRVNAGQEAALILDRTCFYAEQGGQVGDQGSIRSATGTFDVQQTIAVQDIVLHVGRVRAGYIDPGQKVQLRVAELRRQTMQNHTATHVMNWALREVLGDHVQQKGSLVDHEKTRFDFSHPKALTPEEIERVEQLVDDRIRDNLDVDIVDGVPISEKPKLDRAGLRAVFEGSYPERVRVMSIGAPVKDVLANPDNPEWRNVSIELCGGTHLKNTAEIEHFVISTEEAVAKGIRRIVGLTGSTARDVENAGSALVQRAEQLKRGPAGDVPQGLSELQNTLTTAQIPVRHRTKLRELTADLQRIAKRQQKADAADTTQLVKHKVAALLARAERIGETAIVVSEMPDLPLEQLKTGADMIKQKCGSAAVLFGVRVAPKDDDQSRDRKGAVDGGKALLLAAMTPDLIKKGLKAGDLVKHIAPIIEGGGGGPPTMAQAGGKNPEKLAEALDAGRQWVVERM